MFGYFAKPKRNDELESLIKSAAKLAFSYCHDYVGVEHVFLCLRELPADHDGKKILDRLPIDLPSFWQTLEDEAKVIINRPIPNILPLTARLKYVLKIAQNLAKTEKQSHISILHFLSSVSLESNSLVAFLLRSHLAHRNPSYTDYDRCATLMIVRLGLPKSMTYEQLKLHQASNLL